MKITEKDIVGQLVAADYRTAEVFAKYKIDFCCKGDRTIAQVCEQKKLNAGDLLADLNRTASSPAGNATIDFSSWPLDLLADYIEKKHHRYVEQKIPVITQYLRKVSQVHGTAHPELIDIYELFTGTAGNLAAHMKKEELILFPFIRKMVTAGDHLPEARFGSVNNPIAMMKEEHDQEGERFRRISELSSSYSPPADACNTYRVAYALLREFEEDLHLHIHLENNILFPGAIALEATLSSHCEA